MPVNSLRQPAASREQLVPAQQKQRHVVGNVLDAGIRRMISEG
jgi:hypothetical protein